LVEQNLLNNSKAPVTHKFVATGNADKFSALARRFLGPEVAAVSQKI
jgi:glutamate racemase